MTTVRLSDLSRTPATPVEQSATVAIPHGNQRECVCVCNCVCVGGWVLGGGHVCRVIITLLLLHLHLLLCSLASVLPRLRFVSLTDLLPASLLFCLCEDTCECQKSRTLAGGEDVSAWGGGLPGEMNRMMSASVLSRVINITTRVRSHSPPSLSLSLD